MNWNKMKTFLIVLFSLINIFLIITMLTKDYKEAVVPQETINDTVEILFNRGISIDKELIPDTTNNMESFSMQTMDFTKLSDDVRIVGSREFDFFMSGEIEDAQDVEDMLEERGIVYVDFVGDTKDITSLSAQEVIDGYKIFGSYLEISVSDGVANVKGSWLTPSSEPHVSKDESEPVHVPGILIDYISNPDRPQTPHSITAIDFGYYVPRYELGAEVQKLTAHPCWRITTDSGQSFHYDSRNGEYLK